MVKRCPFCEKLFEAGLDSSNACPSCALEARLNSDKGCKPSSNQKKFLESDGFFDKEDYIAEEKGDDFYESSEYNTR